jgi:NADH:ubiquinone oxidoreductase subunit 3 (subunit A)
MIIVSSFIQMECFYLLIHFLISLILGILIISLSYFLVTQQPDTEKLSSYECGFDPFGDARNPFNIHFYLVGILFIIFDLEITYLFPWAISLKYLGIFGYWSMFFFLFLLTIGFIYEWIKGALNWT